jgi:N-acetylglucosamine kinase-like BadF-type ATPase
MNSTILLADGGSTKVDWRLVERGVEVKRVTTSGANPFFRTREDIAGELKSALVPALAGHRPDAVYFFGAGCVADRRDIVAGAIADTIDTPYIEVDSDLLAAARGLCGTRPGIACILGTGSNSCFWDGHQIREHIPPLGYLLGDEGSGAVLGRLFLGACLKGVLTNGVRERFLELYGFTTAAVLEAVYRGPHPNRFLASMSPFIAANLHDASVRDLVAGAFRDFFVRNVMRYDYLDNEAHFTGSIAHHYEPLLRRTAASLGVAIGTVTQSPMEGLISYYAAQNRLGPENK